MGSTEGDQPPESCARHSRSSSFDAQQPLPSPTPIFDRLKSMLSLTRPAPQHQTLIDPLPTEADEQRVDDEPADGAAEKGTGREGDNSNEDKTQTQQNPPDQYSATERGSSGSEGGEEGRADDALIQEQQLVEQETVAEAPPFAERPATPPRSLNSPALSPNTSPLPSNCTPETWEERASPPPTRPSSPTPNHTSSEPEQLKGDDSENANPPSPTSDQLQPTSRTSSPREEVAQAMKETSGRRSASSSSSAEEGQSRTAAEERKSSQPRSVCTADLPLPASPAHRTSKKVDETELDFDFGETSLPHLGGEDEKDLAGMSMEELERMIESAGETKQLIEMDEDDSPTPKRQKKEQAEMKAAVPDLASSTGPSPPGTVITRPAITLITTNEVKVVEQRKLSPRVAANFLPVEIPPFAGGHITSNTTAGSSAASSPTSPSTAVPKKELRQPAPISPSEYKPVLSPPRESQISKLQAKIDAAKNKAQQEGTVGTTKTPRVTLTTPTPKKAAEVAALPKNGYVSGNSNGNGGEKVAISPTMVKREVQTKVKTVVPEGSVVYAERLPPWVPPGQPGWEEYIAARAQAPHPPPQSSPSTSNGIHSGTTYYTAAPAPTTHSVPYMPSPHPHSHPTPAPTDFRAYPLPFSSPTPAPVIQTGSGMSAGFPSNLSAFAPAFGGVVAGQQRPPSAFPPGFGPPTPAPGFHTRNNEYLEAVTRQVAAYQAQMQQSVGELAQAESKLKKVGDSLSAALKEKDELSAKLSELSKVKEEKQKWEERAKTLRAREDTLAKEKEEQRRLVMEIERQVRQMEEEKATLQRRLDEAVCEVVRLEDEKHEAEVQNAQALERLSIVKSAGSEEHEQVERLRSELSTLEQRLATEKRRAVEQRQAHESAKLAFLKRSAETIEQLRQERDELLKRVQQAEEEARAREAKLRDLKEEIGSEAYRTRRAEGELKVLTEERADWTSSMDELRGLLEIERRKNAQHEAFAGGQASPTELHSLRAELSRLQHEKEEAVSTAVESSAVIDELTATLEPLEKENKELKQMVEDLLKDAESLSGEVERSKGPRVGPPHPSSATTPRASSPARSTSASVHSTKSTEPAPTSSSSSLNSADLARGKAAIEKQRRDFKASIGRYVEDKDEKMASLALFTGPIGTR